MDPRVADFIREHRTRLTRKAITRQLEEAGHGRDAIDRTWDRLAAEEPITAAGGNGALGWYVWIVYVLGAVAVAFIAQPLFTYRSDFESLDLLGLGWIAAYLLLAGVAAWFLARWRPGSVASGVGLVVLAPLAFVLIGGGICLGTIFVINLNPF